MRTLLYAAYFGKQDNQQDINLIGEIDKISIFSGSLVGTL